MVIKIGVDIVDIKRIEKIVVDNLDSFLKKILSDKEIDLFTKLFFVKPDSNYKRIAQYLAGAFAAKEALMKALGTGAKKLGRKSFAGEGISFKDIQVFYYKTGAPYIVLKDKAQKILKDKIRTKFKKIEVSITHEKDFAVAVVVIFGYFY